MAKTNTENSAPTTKTVKFLTEHFGSVSYTARQAIAVWGEKEVNMKETVSRCYSSDDFRQVSVDRYGCIEEELPCWMDPHEWLRNNVTWKWAWGCGCDKSWPEAWQRFLAYDCASDTCARLAVAKLLKTKSFRSAFRASLRKQLEAWLDTPENERTFSSPFSKKQWEALCDNYTAREAHRLDKVLYWTDR
jgi:hypothetical protein